MKLTVLSLSLLLLSVTGFSQPFMVNIASETGQKFTLYVNNKIQNRKPLPAVNVVTPSEKPSVKIVFLDKKMAPHIQNIQLDEEATAWTLSNRYGKFYLKKNAPRTYDDDDDRHDRNGHSGRGNNRPNGNTGWPQRTKYLPNGTACASANVTDMAFVRMKKEVSDAGYDSRKVPVIKRIFENNCLLASQAAALVGMLSDYTSDQFEMAKLGYLHIYDTENFDQVITAVGSRTHKTALEEFATAEGRPGNRPGNSNSGGYPGNDHTGNSPSLYCQGVKLTATQFTEALQSIRSASFEQTKLEQAKLVVKNNCLSVMQIREITRLFDFEETKLNFAKYAYDHTYEANTYYLVNQEFDFEQSKTDLANYISQRN